MPPPELDLLFTLFSPATVTDLAYVVRREPTREMAKVVLYPTARSPVYRYRGPAPLTLVDTPSGAIVATIDVPATMGEALIILFPLQPVPTKGPRYRAYLHDDSRLRRGSGGLGVLNFSGLAITGSIGGEQVELGNGFHGPYPIGAAGTVVLRTLAKGRLLQTYSEKVRLGPNGRGLLILLPPFYAGSLEVQSRLLVD